MAEIENLCRDGFTLPSLGRNMDSIAFISLKAALKSYFTTYKGMAYHGREVFENNLESHYYSSEYIEHYFETIIHFQHFFELICKDILRKENELLVLNIDNNHEVLFKLVKGEEVQSEELVNINTIEFDRTFKRLCDLISKGKIDSCYSFFNDTSIKETLKHLNIMRNRIWHRGIYVMKYKDLDLFIGKYILPIVEKVISLPEYSNLNRIWQYRKLESGIEPLNEIIRVSNLQYPSIDHIAFLKEMGRAAYHNPHEHSFGWFKKEITNRAANIAINEIPHPSVKDDYIMNCPVCGTKSLVKYEDSEGEIDDSGQHTSYLTWVNSIKCYCCSFELHSRGMKNPSEYGYSVPDFWYEYEH